MSEAVVAKRYAEALFQIGTEKNTLQSLGNDLRIIRDVFTGNKEISMFLSHPRVSGETKKDMIDNALKGIDKYAVNTLKLMIDRDRTDIIPLLTDYFINLVNEENKVAEGKVYSVRELTKNEKSELEKSFAKRLNKKQIELTNIVDPSILGGVKIQIGNTIYDGTISGKLNRLKRNIATANK